MNYPTWQIPSIGGSTLIALIAIVHVYVAHLAVGGGLFLVLTEHKARRSGDEALLGYVKRHSRFFLLLTLVFGGLTGVGIWFIISLVHPAGTSSLIHAFVFGWAIEWTFFIGEIVALLVYAYTFDRMRPSTHLAMGWIYFVFAWLSLAVINGILTFMLTPGRWLETGGFWTGVLNPTYFASLAYRTAFALVVAGLFGLVTAVALRDDRLRGTITRWCARWMILPFLALAAATWWYVAIVPPEPLENLMGRNPQALPYARIFFWAAGIVFLGGLLSLIRLPRGAQTAVVAVLVAVGLAWTAGFEYVREIARKPYVIHGHMYSSSVPVAAVDDIRENGYLARAKWVRHHEVTDANRLEAGEDLFNHQCLACHSVGGHNNVAAHTAGAKEYGLRARLDGQGKLATYMPPFFGTREERDALAAYIREGVQGQAPQEIFPEVPIAKRDAAPESFDSAREEYVLLAWNDLGMHCLSDSDPYFVLLPPANTLWAQLVRRGPVPAIVTEGVELRYTPEEGFERPESKVRFWEFAKANFGADLDAGVGLLGKRVSGVMDPQPSHGAFVAPAVPVVPYPESGGFDPYPRLRIEAVETASGRVLARTWVVAPVSSEMGCRNCHAGDWTVDGRAGVSDATAEDILRVHDRISGTSLLAEAEAGRPRACATCHADPAVAMEGDGERLNLSAAMHGFHANYLSDMGADACASCHPARTGGATRCLRGRHAASLTCVECHGTLEEHALALLVGEREAASSGAQDARDRSSLAVSNRGVRAERLMRHLHPSQVALEEIAGRTPWIHEPDCLTCHVDFSLAEISSYNHWTASEAELYRNRADERGVRCAACHGSTHAVYPATNAYAATLDNLQPLQYQGEAGTISTGGRCAVCHTRAMPGPGHHPNMLRL